MLHKVQGRGHAGAGRRKPVAPEIRMEAVEIQMAFTVRGMARHVVPMKKGRQKPALLPYACGKMAQATFFSSSADHRPREAREFMRARWVKAAWAAATFSALPAHAFCGAA